MNEQTIERVAKHMAAFNGDPDAWGAYASQAMDVIELAEETIEFELNRAELRWKLSRHQEWL